MSEIKSTLELLERLKTELTALESDDPEAEQRVSDLLERIEHRIENHVDEDEHREFLEDVTAEVVEFEVEHPDLAAVIRGVMRFFS